MPDEQPRARIADIEILRAVAIALVMAQHAYHQLVFHQQWLLAQMAGAPMSCGVDLFFAVSGFVITRGLLPGVLAQAPRAALLARFWLRRTWRLWPAAWAWLGVILAGSFIFRNPAVFDGPGPNIQAALAGVFAYENIWFPRHFLSPHGPAYPYWSLSLEEQFYALLPPVMLLARRRMWLVAATLLLIQFPLRHGMHYQFFRNDALLWGVLLAAAPPLLRRAPAAARALRKIPLGGPIVLALAIAAMTQLSPPLDSARRFEFGLLGTCAAVPVWLASADLDLFHAGVLQRFMLWLGSRSYVLYLCHVPLYLCVAALSRRIGPVDPLFGAHTDLRNVVIGLPLVAGAAELTHRLVETPCRTWGYRRINQLFFFRNKSPARSEAREKEAVLF